MNTYIQQVSCSVEITVDAQLQVTIKDREGRVMLSFTMTRAESLGLANAIVAAQKNDSPEG